MIELIKDDIIPEIFHQVPPQNKIFKIWGDFLDFFNNSSQVTSSKMTNFCTYLNNFVYYLISEINFFECPSSKFSFINELTERSKQRNTV